MSTALLNPPCTLDSARSHHAQNHLLQAAQAYRQTLESNPQSQPALLGLSLIARQSNQLQPALRMAQAALAAGPENALAWANYGDLLLAARQLPAAQSAFLRALVLDPNTAVAHYGLANTLVLQADRAENYAAALPHFAQAAQLNPTLPEFHFAQAFAHGKLGEHAAAIAAYRRAVQLRPNFASAWLNLGVELIADGRDQIAELSYRQALACASNPDTQISTHLNHGHLHRSRKNYPAAQSHYQAALAIAEEKSPNRLAETHVAFTYLHLEQQQFEQAHQSLKAAESAQTQNHPSQPNPEIPNVRGILLLAEQAMQVPHPEEATRAEEAMRIPQAAEAMRVPLVSPLRPGSDAGPDHQTEEIANRTKGTGFSPYIENHTGKGASAPGGSDLLNQAIQAFHQAEQQGHKTAPSNRGNALLRLGRVQEALEAHQEALRRDPHHPGVRYNLALTQLRSCNFREGWQNYEIRWQFREVHPHPRRFPQPRWQGQPLPATSRLFIHAEQGLGDTLQFLRYLPTVLNRLRNLENPGAPGLDSRGPQRQVLVGGAEETGVSQTARILFGGTEETGVPPTPQILLEVQPPLRRLITDSLRPQRRHPERSEGPASPLAIQVIAQGDPIPPFTHHIPLMSLPALFATTLETIPTPIPYLFPPATNAGAPSFAQQSLPQQSGQWEQRIPKIGLHWAGNPNYRADRERSTHLQTFLPLLQLPNIQWISLQKGPATHQIAEIPPEIRPLNASSSDRDLADTAATIQSLDLILTTDSAVAHLAGAMGKPLWLLLPWQSDWRWMQSRLDTPWYPQARLFRQSSPHNWPELIARVARELQALPHPARVNRAPTTRPNLPKRNPL